jgi:hypothetical protein
MITVTRRGMYYHKVAVVMSFLVWLYRTEIKWNASEMKQPDRCRLRVHGNTVLLKDQLCWRTDTLRYGLNSVILLKDISFCPNVCGLRHCFLDWCTKVYTFHSKCCFRKLKKTTFGTTSIKHTENILSGCFKNEKGKPFQQRTLRGAKNVILERYVHLRRLGYSITRSWEAC